jgi:putative membrane protein
MNDQKTKVSSALVIGALAGLAATVPMTLFMGEMHQQLPVRERYPLPPSEIVEELTEQAGIGDQINQPEHMALTLLAHFGYGAATGALYAPLAETFRPPAMLGGAAFGLGVWSASYLGLLPALGVLRPATEHPVRRNALMIGAHVVWGVSLGLMVEQLLAEAETRPMVAQGA